MDNLHEQLEAIKTTILNQVVTYAKSNGVEFPIDSLIKNVSFTREDLDVLLNPPKPKPKKIKFNPKKKPMFKPNDYKKFVTLCNKHELVYFEFYDEHKWNGPAIKVDDAEYDIICTYFDSLDIHSITGTDFYIIRPKHKFKDTTNYPDIKIETCMVEPYSLIVPTSDNEQEEPKVNSVNSIYDATTDEELELEEWEHPNTKIKYLLDIATNIIYSDQTEQPIGKKIDEFTIKFN